MKSRALSGYKEDFQYCVKFIKESCNLWNIDLIISFLSFIHGILNLIRHNVLIKYRYQLITLKYV